MMASLCTLLVGAVFLGSGLLKALNANAFLGHVCRYRVLPLRLLGPVALGLN
jgi:hypothetical protein